MAETGATLSARWPTHGRRCVLEIPGYVLETTLKSLDVLDEAFGL